MNVPTEPVTQLVAVGDLQLGDSPTMVGFGFRSTYPNEARMREWATHVKRQLGDADVVFGNLEGVISEAGLSPNEWKSLQLRGRPFYAEYLRKAGLTILNVANNHTFQHGEPAFRDTVRLLEEADIAVVGVRGDRPWHCRPVVLETRAGKVGFLAYCFRPRQYSSGRPPYAEGDPDRVCEDVNRLRSEVPAVAVSLHWGEEFVMTPSEAEVAAASDIIDAGATLIIGHHPHVLRALQQLGSGAVAYSLGNFSGDMIWHEPFRSGGILRCSLGENGLVDPRLETVRVEESYLPHLTGTSIGPTESIVSLSEEQYQRDIERTVREQRRDAYRYALRNLRRFPPRILLRLLHTTVRNKIVALVRRDG